ncbi:hypothetical protein [Bacillus taeanensis]|uniref:Uncharacterized protein n=1 Tax=Bacillus taeanensis TaxID=273032 RepID=A0A366XV04_9BACI|nr:hypothetical protein [Bacillus taeanensis]RBW69962.1 hypothetical protein DS031_08900 [Bacillus taeanensis]
MTFFNHSSETEKTYSDAVHKIVHSIVETELSLAKLINKEASELHFLIKNHFSHSDTSLSQHAFDLLKSQSTMMNTILMKEWLLTAKLELLIPKNIRIDDVKDSIHPEENEWNDVIIDEEE